MMYLFFIQTPETSWIKDAQMEGKYTNIPMEAEVPNNLIYTYNFSTNSWRFFKELTNPMVDAYSCTTFQAKNFSK